MELYFGPEKAESPFPMKIPFPEVWCLVKHLLQFWLEAVSGKENEAAAREEAHWDCVFSQAAALSSLPEAEVFPSACSGESEPGCLAPPLKLSPGSIYSTLSAMFSRPGKMTSNPCFHDSTQMFHLPVLCRTSRRKSNWQPGTTRISRPTRSCWSHRTPGLSGSCWASRVLWPILLRWVWHGRWVISCWLQRRGWHFLTAQVRWRLLVNLVLKCGGSLKPVRPVWLYFVGLQQEDKVTQHLWLTKESDHCLIPACKTDPA